MSAEIQQRFMALTERYLEEMLQIECSTTQRDLALRVAMDRLAAELATKPK